MKTIGRPLVPAPGTTVAAEVAAEEEGFEDAIAFVPQDRIAFPSLSSGGAEQRSIECEESIESAWQSAPAAPERPGNR